MARVSQPESFTASHHAAIAHTSAMIKDGTIVNIDIAAAAAIAKSKLALADTILNADINSAAAIVHSKLKAQNVTIQSAGSDEQTASSSVIDMFSGVWIRGAQKRTLSNRLVTKLGFELNKVGSPTGDVTFTVRKVSDDAIVLSKVWGDASALTTARTWYEAAFDTPVNINEEVRLCVEFSGGDASNYVRVRKQVTDVKADERACAYDTSWAEYATEDLAYKVYWGERWVWG